MDVDLNTFRDYAKEHPECWIKITFNDTDSKFGIWVFSTKLMVGQHVFSVDEINLEKEKEEQDKKLFAKLQAKFENKVGVV